MESSSTAAIWSAVAASFAALSSLLIWRVQTKTLTENARPQIILSNWERSNLEGNTEVNTETLSFGVISNAGKGSALHIHINSVLNLNTPTYSMPTYRLPVLAVNGKVEERQNISIRWGNVPEPASGGKHVSVEIMIYCWDTIGNRHETTYSLFVVENTRNQVVGDQIIPGVALVFRRVHSVSVRWLKAKVMYTKWKEKALEVFNKAKK